MTKRFVPYARVKLNRQGSLRNVSISIALSASKLGGPLAQTHVPCVRSGLTAYTSLMREGKKRYFEFLTGT